MQAAELKIRVRYTETGRMGYAHHGDYYNWFDIAKQDFLKKYGLTYKDIEDAGYFFPPVKDECRFKNPARYDDELTIRMRVTELGTIKVAFEYEVVREKDMKIIALASAIHAFVDKNFKPVAIKHAFPELYRALNDFLESQS